MNDAIYLSLTFIGEVVERDSRRFEGFDSSGEALGVFQSRAKAARAVLDHDVEERAMEAPTPT